MKMMILPEENLLDIKSNLDSLQKNFQLPTNEWLFDYFDGSPFKESKYDIPSNINLDMSNEKPFETEYHNVKSFYHAMKFLSDSEASEERIWASLCLGPFYAFTKYRWSIDSLQSIKDHFFFGQSHRRSLMRNAMARLWWIGRLTYMPEHETPFALTDFVCRHSDFIFHLLERNFSNNKQVLWAFSNAIMSVENDGCVVDTNAMGELSKYLNLLGGIHILDCVDYEWIFRKSEKRILAAAKVKKPAVE